MVGFFLSLFCADRTRVGTERYRRSER